MNAGKKLIRNTVFGLWGVAALFVGLNRLNATQNPQGGEGFLTMGLLRDTEPEAQPEIDLAAARDFTRISVRGPVRLEVVGANQFKVSLDVTQGEPLKVRAWITEGTLHMDGGESAGPRRGVLRVEAPTLQRIDAGPSDVFVQGLSAPELEVYMYNGGVVQLQQNQVQRWQFNSGESLEARVDDATFAAGSLSARGDVLIRRAP